MTFECKICGKRWDEQDLESEGTFYTLCPSCEVKDILDVLRGIREKNKK